MLLMTQRTLPNRLAVLLWTLGLATACSVPTEPAPSGPAGAPVLENEPELELSPLACEAYARLRAAERFTDDGIYDDGITPNEVRALRILWQEPSADLAFARLEREATLAGRLFALCGLYFSDRDRFDARIEEYRGSTEQVFFQTGCIGFRDQPVAELIESSHAGVVRLTGNENVCDWLAAQGNPKGTKGGYRYDILGGGYPNLFRSGGGWTKLSHEPFVPEAD